MTESQAVVEPDRSRWSGILGWLATLAVAAAAALIVIWSGLAFNIVSTDSMVPTLSPTDMVITVDPKLIQPDIGSVVVFTASFLENDIPPHVHRIVGAESTGEWITKGDNSVDPDPWRVKPENVQGVMVGSAPTQLIRNPVLLGIGMFLVLAILFWPRSNDDESPGESLTEDDRSAARPSDAGLSLLPVDGLDSQPPIPKTKRSEDRSQGQN